MTLKVSKVKNIAKALTLSAKRLKFSYQIFNGDRLQYYTTEEYNHFCEVKDWMQDLFSIGVSDMIAYRPLGEDNHLSQNCQYILLPLLWKDPISLLLI